MYNSHHALNSPLTSVHWVDLVGYYFNVSSFCFNKHIITPHQRDVITDLSLSIVQQNPLSQKNITIIVEFSKHKLPDSIWKVKSRNSSSCWNFQLLSQGLSDHRNRWKTFEIIYWPNYYNVYWSFFRMIIDIND